jgi:hypothetical protein
MKTLLFLLLSNTCIAQTAMWITLNVERVPVNSANTPNSTTTETVLLILDEDKLGVITESDTLGLIKTLTFPSPEYNPNNRESVSLYKDVAHYGQPYSVKFVQVKDGRFAIFISPLKPYTRKLYAITLSSL